MAGPVCVLVRRLGERRPARWKKLRRASFPLLVEPGGERRAGEKIRLVACQGTVALALVEDGQPGRGARIPARFSSNSHTVARFAGAGADRAGQTLPPDVERRLVLPAGRHPG